MEKFCVFCGQAPESKNKEHVIPKWLIEITGDPNRIATFGVNIRKKPYGMRQFSFDSLVFPACSACNSNFGQLEEQVEPIVVRLISFKPLSSQDLTLLLDWLDKIRVGLWLGYMYLDQNLMGITPSYHIDSRLARMDRMMGVFKLTGSSSGITFSGPEFRTYQLSPTCFVLRINDIALRNASGKALCSQRLGFPYLELISMTEDGQAEVEPKVGSERTMYPVERFPTLRKSLNIYQPIFRLFHEIESGEQFIKGEWLKDRTLNMSSGQGKIFLQDPESVSTYPDGESDNWVPTDPWNTLEFQRDVPRYVFERLTKDLKNGSALISSRERREEMRKVSTVARMIDKAILRKNEATIRLRQKERLAVEKH